MNKFYGNLIEKILLNLINKQGFIIEEGNIGNVVIRDSFGYRYSLNIEFLGRTKEDRDFPQKHHDLATLKGET